MVQPGSNSMTDLSVLQRGEAPLLISIPHQGTHIQNDLRDCYSDTALTLVDTDRRLDHLCARLYKRCF
jgi:N-formylglutamate deformylase